ncbi:MAG: DUF4328 domain-containing protein, partial [Actinomycetota bacterium]
LSPAPGSAGAPPSFGATPPPGYVPFGSSGPVQLVGTSGLRVATIVLFWAVVASNVGVAIAAASRRSTWDDFVDGRATIFDIDDADNTIAGIAVLNLVLAIAAGIVLSIWSLRAARNLQAVGGQGVKPGWACGGWYIPIGQLWVPWGHLRRGHRSIQGDTRMLSWWQGLWIGSTVLGFMLRNALDVDGFASDDSISSQLGQQTLYAGFQSLILAAAAYTAMRSMRSIEASVAAKAS